MSFDELYKQAVLRFVPSLWKLNNSCAHVSWALPFNEPNLHASFLKQDSYLCVFSRSALCAASNIEISGFLAGWRSISLAGVFFCLAGVSGWLAGAVFVWLESLSGWSDFFLGCLESPPGWLESLPGWLVCLSGPLEYLFPGWLESPFFHLFFIFYSRQLFLSLISDCLSGALKAP